MLKVLEVEGAVDKDGTKYRRTDEPWTYPTERIEHITAQRRAEQQVMTDYLASDTCLMELLGRALDDPSATACGRCARCTGNPITVELDRALVVEAQEFLRREPLSIDPRKRDAQNKKIPDDHQLDAGRALSYWGDGGWGGLVRDQRAAGHFSDELVDAAVRLVRTWAPQPRPTWVTCVPSHRDPQLVASFAARVAAGLRLPFRDCVTKVRANAPQTRDGEHRPAAPQRRRRVRGDHAVPVGSGAPDRRHRRLALDADRGRRPPARGGRGPGPARSRSPSPRATEPPRSDAGAHQQLVGGVGELVRPVVPEQAHVVALVGSGSCPRRAPSSHTSGPVNDRYAVFQPR